MLHLLESAKGEIGAIEVAEHELLLAEDELRAAEAVCYYYCYFAWIDMICF